jgi:predicted CXXCH cytochrome family protein
MPRNNIRQVFTLGLVLMQCMLVAGNAAAVHTQCSDCHARGRALKKGTVNELCISCHPENVKDHVLDVISKTAPAGLPLARGNRITCITCHDAHDKSGNPKLLRLEQAEICAPCHPKAKGPQ